MHVLQIEKNLATAQQVELMLQAEGFDIYTTDLGEEGVALAPMFDYDIILLELCLSDISGYQVLRTLRAKSIVTPVIVLSGLKGIEDIVKGLDCGADDYLTKPFHKDELVARIHAVVRRSVGSPSNKIDVGPLTLNLQKKIATIDGYPIHVTRKEYMLLELLVLNRNKVTTKENVMNHLYGGMDEPDMKIVDVFVCRLRQKLHSSGLIETVWGLGYRVNE